MFFVFVSLVKQETFKFYVGNDSVALFAREKWCQNDKSENGLFSLLCAQSTMNI